MFCNDYRQVLLLLIIMAMAILIFNKPAKPAPTLHQTDFLEAEACGRAAVLGAGEDEVALVVLDGDIQHFVNRYCVSPDPNISTYVVGKVTGVMRNEVDSRIVVDGVLVNESDHEIVGVTRFEVGDTVLVRVHHASRRIAPVYAERSKFGPAYMWSPRGKRAMEMLNDYRKAKAMEASNGR